MSNKNKGLAYDFDEFENATILKKVVSQKSM
jgi:hypothetical protein